jgi:hypothetical protein
MRELCLTTFGGCAAIRLENKTTDWCQNFLPKGGETQPTAWYSVVLPEVT